MGLNFVINSKASLEMFQTVCKIGVPSQKLTINLITVGPFGIFRTGFVPQEPFDILKQLLKF